MNKGAQNLVGKDVHAFKQLSKFHESKNFKKGLKNAEKLLRTNPDHPQTHAMKALFQLALGDDSKALQTAKTAVMKSKMTSMFCWQTLSGVYKHRKDFIQAAKSSQNAIRFDPDNIQLLRETACLQIQIRDHASHVTTRLNILTKKPNMIQNWTAFTIAHHLREDYFSLFKALNSLNNLIKTTQIKPNQYSNYLVYRIIAFRDASRYTEMYQQLIKHKNEIKDNIIWNEMMYQVCIKLNKIDKSIESIRNLLKQFPQNIEYIENYRLILNKSINNQQYYKLIVKDFNSKIGKIYQLKYIKQLQQFKQEFIKFIKPYYKKNLISLFTEIQIIYETKQKQIEQIFLEFEKNLKEMKYPDGQQAISPSQYLWSLYLLAQHYSRHFSTLKLAYQYIIRSIQHTSTISEMYVVKAEIQYRMHNNLSCLKTINQARKTDLADRYMNNICVKYLMKCQKPMIAQQVLRLFMLDEISLYELQNHWYIIQAAKSFLHKYNFEAGLRHINFIKKHFEDMISNELDFHNYCIRKWSLRIQKYQKKFKKKKY